MPENWIDWMGVCGAILFGLKILLHIYLKSLYTPNYDPGPGSPFLKLELFLPSFDEVEKKYLWVKKTVNIMYGASVVMIAVFVIFGNNKSK